MHAQSLNNMTWPFGTTRQLEIMPTVTSHVSQQRAIMCTRTTDHVLKTWNCTRAQTWPFYALLSTREARDFQAQVVVIRFRQLSAKVIPISCKIITVQKRWHKISLQLHKFYLQCALSACGNIRSLLTDSVIIPSMWHKLRVKDVVKISHSTATSNERWT